jgi:hypothetical protein
MEWNVGQAAFALDTKQDPGGVHASPAARAVFQRRLVAEGIPLARVIARR